MSDTNLAEEIYSQRDLFDELGEQNQGINEKNSAGIRSGIKLLAVTLNARMDVLEAKIDKVDAKVDNLDSKLNSKIDGVENKLETKIDNLEAKLEAKIDGVGQEFSTAIEGLLDLFDDMIDYQNKWFTVFGILFTATAIIAPVAVAVVQHFLK